VIFDKTRAYDVYEVPIQEGARKQSANVTMFAVRNHKNILDNHNQDFRQSVPIFVDADKGLIDRRAHMAWNKDAKHSDIDTWDNDRGCDLEFRRGRSSFCDDGDSIDNDLHQELHFECVEDKDEEKESRPAVIVSERFQSFVLMGPREYATTNSVAELNSPR
jgi:hypothetical protein